MLIPEESDDETDDVFGEDVDGVGDLEEENEEPRADDVDEVDLDLDSDDEV